MSKTKERKPSARGGSDFCFLNGRDDARLSDVERLTLLGGGGLDRVLERMAKALDSVSLEVFSSSLEPSVIRAHAARLEALRASGAVAQLFTKPERHQAPSIVPVHGFPFGSVVDLAFPSQFPPSSWCHEPSYLEATENATSYVRLWEHNDDHGERPTIVAIHGWTMGDQRVNSLAFMPGLFYSLGCNVALVELPFHGRRRPLSIPEHRPLFPDVDPVRTAIAMGHALFDLRVLRLFLEERGHRRVSCVGMSLGAYIGALWGSLDTLHRCVLLVPLVSMGDMAAELVRRRFGEGSKESEDLSGEFLRGLFADHYPLKGQPCTPQEQVMVIRGKGDQLVSRGQIALLRREWPRAKYLWSDGGHGAGMKRGETFSRMTEFLLGKGA